MAIIGAFIPFVGIGAIPLGVLGALFGLLGLRRVAKKRASNRGVTIAGLALSGVAAIVAIIAVTTFFNNVQQAVNNSGAQPAEPNGNENPNGNGNANGSKPGQFPGQRHNDVVVQAGQPVKFGGADVTADQLKPTSNALGHYLCTHVSYDNQSSDQVSYNTLDWSLQSPSGNIKIATFAGVDNELNAGNLAPGGKTAGVVCFDKPSESSGKFVVLIEGFFSLSDARGAWINNL